MIELAIWLGFVLLNGIAFGELLSLWNGSFTLRVATALGSGLALMVPVALLLFRGAFDFRPLLAVSALSGSILLASVIRRRILKFWTQPTRNDGYFFLVCILPVALIILANLAKNPLFPGAPPSVDFVAHVRDVASLMNAFPSAPSGQLLYYGVYYQLVPLAALSNGPTFFAVRYGMVLLTVISPYPVYLCARSLFELEWPSMAVTMLYSVGASVWFLMNFDSGLYANFYGLLASLFLVYATSRFFKEKAGLSGAILLALAFLNAYFSHYSTLILFPALLVYAAMKMPETKGLKRSLIYLAFIFVPLGAGMALFPNVLPTLVSFTKGGGGFAPVPTWLAWIFYDPGIRSVMAVPAGLPWINLPFPALGYLIAEVSNDWASLIMLLLLVPYCRSFIKSKDRAVLLIPLVWFLTALAVAPPNSVGWRFSLAALLPLLLMDGAGLFLLVPFEQVKKKAHRFEAWPTKKGVGLTLLLGWMLIFPVPLVSSGSWGSQAVVGASIHTDDFSNQQQSAYRAIQWMKAKGFCGTVANATTPRPCTAAVSVDYQPYVYSELFGSVFTYYAPQYVGQWANPQQVEFFAFSKGAELLVVSRISPLSYPVQNLTTLHDTNLTALQDTFLRVSQNISSGMKAGTLVGYPVKENATGFYATLAVQFDPWSVYSPTSLACSWDCLVWHDDYTRIYCIASSCEP